MKKINLVLPKPPSVNHLYSVTCRFGKPRHYMKAEGKSWFEMCGWYIKQQLSEYLTIDEPVKVKIVLSFFGRHDLDNVFKCSLDILTDYKIIEDDSQVYEIEAKKVRVKERQKEQLEIEITPLTLF